jgi:single-stranded-DNA-specific exonuclease
LIAIDGAKGKGSGRSPKVFHLYEGLKACAEVLEGYGGHRQAAGLSIQANRIPAFAEKFETTARARLTSEDLVSEIEVDDEVDLAMMNIRTMDEVRLLEPYGQGNPEPVFLARAVDAIGFGMGDLPLKPRVRISVLYTPEINVWNGNANLQLRLRDLKFE